MNTFLSSLISAFLLDVLTVIKQNPQIFSSSEKGKSDIWEQYFASKHIGSTLAGLTEEQLQTELENTVLFLKGNTKDTTLLITALMSFLQQEFSSFFDTLPKSFFLQDAPQIKASLEKSLSPHHTNRFLIQQLTHQPVLEFSRDISDAFLQLFDSPYILTQSAQELSPEIKKQIRAHFLEHHPNSFVLFLVQTQLLGGMKVFIDGKVNDLSWFGRATALSKLSLFVD